MEEQRRGAIGVAVNELGQLLVIERSQHVRAPGKLCFPGGSIEFGESDRMAVKRELMEELSLIVEPVERVWHSQKGGSLELFWWRVEIVDEQEPIANETEVARWFWMDAYELAQESMLLYSNKQFLLALERGEIDLK